MANGFYFFQAEGKESRWTEALAERREALTRDIQPAFSTVLDLSMVPDNNEDWGKVKYRGPFYGDFDAGDDLPYVCDQFKEFLGKLHAELDFDLTQARFYASGSKGFHKPRVFRRTVVRNQVHNHFETQTVSGGLECIKVGKCAKQGINVAVVRHVIASIFLRTGHERGEPDGVNA